MSIAAVLGFFLTKFDAVGGILLLVGYYGHNDILFFVGLALCAFDFLMSRLAGLPFPFVEIALIGFFKLAGIGWIHAIGLGLAYTAVLGLLFLPILALFGLSLGRSKR